MNRAPKRGDSKTPYLHLPCNSNWPGIGIKSASASALEFLISGLKELNSSAIISVRIVHCDTKVLIGWALGRLLSNRTEPNWAHPVCDRFFPTSLSQHPALCATQVQILAWLPLQNVAVKKYTPARIRAEKTMTATDVTGFDAIFSTGFFATFNNSGAAEQKNS